MKYLSTFWRSLEMPLINCKAELKLKRDNILCLAGADVDNTNGNPTKIIFTIKDTQLYVLVVT